MKNCRPVLDQKNGRHSVPVVVRRFIARAGICCVVERKLSPNLNLILSLGYNDFKSNWGCRVILCCSLFIARAMGC